MIMEVLKSNPIKYLCIQHRQYQRTRVSTVRLVESAQAQYHKNSSDKTVSGKQNIFIIRVQSLVPRYVYIISNISACTASESDSFYCMISLQTVQCNLYSPVRSPVFLFLTLRKCTVLSHFWYLNSHDWYFFLQIPNTYFFSVKKLAVWLSLGQNCAGAWRFSDLVSSVDGQGGTTQSWSDVVVLRLSSSAEVYLQNVGNNAQYSLLSKNLNINMN